MSRAGANGQPPEPFDLEAAAEAAKGEGKPFAFTFKGQAYEVPPGTDWSVGALAALGAGDLEGSLSQLLGPEAFSQLVEAGLNVGQLNTLFERIGQEVGLGGLGNLPRPARRASARK